MSSGTATPPPLPAEPASEPRVSPQETFIDERIRQARYQVKGVDILGGLLSLTVGALIYLLLAVLVDHWAISGGLGFWGRLLVLLGLLGAGGWYAAGRVLPPLIYRINPLFAARTIENSQPSLKNSLINFLLLRGQREHTPRLVFQAVRHRAASDLSHVQIETAVDRTGVVRLGYLLIVTLTVCCLYFVLSPKSVFSSVGRVIWPWADIKAPSRVSIEDVRPGDALAYHGDTVTVSAEVVDIREDESVWLYYSTADGQIVERPVRMSPRKSGFRHQGQLPAGGPGLQQDVEYYLAAGDCRTRRFRIDVQVAPTIVVEKVRYDYPDYAGITDRTVDRQGDIRALEGTQVTVHAAANREIQRAEIDFDCNGLPGQPMKSDGIRAAGRFRLRMSEEDPLAAEHDCYQLRFADREGRPNRRPIRHRIEVVPDIPPEVRILYPRQEDFRLAEDGQLEIQVQAEDADYALRKVVLELEKAGEGLDLPPLLDRPHPQQPWQGPFEGKCLFEPARLGLKAGDRVRYWAEAEDNKHWDGLGPDRQPPPGRDETIPRWITIVASGSQPPPRERPDSEPGPSEQRTQDGPQSAADRQADQARPPEEDQAQTANQDRQPDEDRQTQRDDPPGPDLADQAAGREQAAQPGGSSRPPDAKGQAASERPGPTRDQPSEEPQPPIDGETNPGDAFEEILDHHEQQEQGQGEPQPGNQQSRSEQTGGNRGANQPAAGPQPGDQPSGPQEPSDPAATGSEAAEDGRPGEPSGDPQRPDQRPDPDHQTGDAQPGKGQAGAEQTGREPSAAEKSPSEPSREAPSDRQPKAGQPSGDQQQRDEQHRCPECGGAGCPKCRGGGQGSQKGGQRPDGAGSLSSQGGAESQRNDDNVPAGQKPRPGSPGQGGRGAQAQGPGEKGSRDATGQDPERPHARGGDPQSAQREPGAGKPSGNDSGSPLPQEANQPRDKASGDPGENPGQRRGPKPESPSTSPKDSDSRGDTSGDRSGGGEEGGGQQANQPGTGTAGTHSAAEQGGSQAPQQGEGEAGSRAGDQVQTDRRTGSTAVRQQPGRPGGQRQPGASPSDETRRQSTDSSRGGTPLEQPADAGQPGEQTSQGPTAHGQGNPTVGGRGGMGPNLPPPPDGRPPGGDDPNLEYAAKQTDLALEHLKDQMARGKSDLLERLGWSREEARRFVDRWEKMKDDAAQGDEDGRAAQRRLDEALRSLGLRPGGSEQRGSQAAPDQLRNLRESGRFDPPPEWAEYFKAYTEGVARGGRR